MCVCIYKKIIKTRLRIIQIYLQICNFIIAMIIVYITRIYVDTFI